MWISNLEVRDQNGNRNAPPRRADIAEVERQIASLADRSTQDLRVTWRQLHHTGPPPGLSRDLLIRTLAYQLQERTYGGVSLALQRRLLTLSAEFEKGASSHTKKVSITKGPRRLGTESSRDSLLEGDGFELLVPRHESP